nr:MAG TPA: hypothetical protein [Caudoviricetes sp.]
MASTGVPGKVLTSATFSPPFIDILSRREGEHNKKRPGQW